MKKSFRSLCFPIALHSFRFRFLGGHLNVRLAALFFVALLPSLSIAEDVSTARGLHDVMTASGSQTIVLTADIYTDTLVDEDGYQEPFILSLDDGTGITGKTMTITSDGKTIAYSATASKTAHTDNELFFMEIGEGGALTFTDAARLDGGAGWNGGLFYLTENGTLAFQGDAALSNNYSDYGGGAVTLDGDNQNTNNRPTLTVGGHAILTSNYSAGDGGALYAYAADATFQQKVTATGNLSENFGGAFFLENGAVVSINPSGADWPSTFSQNVAGYVENDLAGGSGGAVFASASTFSIGGAVTFDANRAATGGAVHAELSTLTFKGATTFSNNKAEYGDGGAMLIDSSKVDFQGNATFAGNTADDGTGGGAIALIDQSYVNDGDRTKLTFAGTTLFDGNKVLNDDAYGGGAIHADQVGDNATDSIADEAFGLIASGSTTFSENSSASHGGAIFAYDSALKFGETLFQGNVSNYLGEDGGGGAIFLEGSRLVFTGATTLTDNKATGGSGGGAFLQYAGSTVASEMNYGLRFNAGASISGNTATEHGGAFYLDNSSVLFGGTTTISGNTAKQGGAFYIYGDSLLQFQAGSTTTLSGNTGTEHGGALYVGSAELVLKLDGADEKRTTLTIAADSSGKNDVYLDDGSYLYVDTGNNASVFVNSDLAGENTGSMEIVKQGVGNLFLNGDASDYYGSLTIEGGRVYLGKDTLFGKTDMTILKIEAGGDIVLELPETASSNPKLSLLDLYLDPSAEILVKASSDRTDATGKHILIELDNESGILDQDMLDAYAASVESYYDFLKVTAWGELETDKGMIYASAEYDTTKDPVFDLPSIGDEFTLHAALDKSGVNLVVTGDGVLTLASADKTANGVSGNGNIHLDDGVTLILAGHSDATFSGNIGNADTGSNGSLVKNGDSTQTLTGSSSYTGGTTVNVGTLRGSSQSLQDKIDVKSGATLAFDQSLLGELPNAAFAGTLSGSGIVRVSGINIVDKGIESDGGILKMTGDNGAFAGTTQIDKGWLVLESTSSTAAKLGGTVQVNSGGGLGGYGQVLSNVIVNNGGVLQAHKGTLNVGGNVEFKQGGTMYVYADGQQTAVVDVAGNVTIDGASVKVIGVGQHYVQNESFDFLKADQIDGNFSNSTASYSDGTTSWNFDLSKSDDNKSYGMTGTGDTPDPPGPIPVPTPAGLTWNQGEIARALNTVDGHSGTPVGFQAMIGDLKRHKTTDENGNPEYDDIYRDIVGRQLAGTIRTNGLQLGLFSPYRNVFNRISLGSELYGGVPIIYNNGYGAISGLENTRGGRSEPLFLGQYGPCEPQANCYGDAAIPCMMGENNFWVDVIHVQTKTKADDNSDKYGISRTGFLIGADVQKTSSSRIGLVFGYFAPYLWQNNDRVEADDYHVGLYFQKAYCGAELTGYFGYAHQEYDSRRYVDLSALGAEYGQERYTGGTKGDSFNLSLELSKPRYYGCDYILRPLIGLDYVYTSQKGFAESGSGTGLYALNYGKAEADRLFVRLGANLKKETFRYSAVIRLQYINQFGGDSYPDGAATFATVGGAPGMSLRGVDLKKDYLNAGLGINLFVNPARSKLLSFDYDANMSRRTTDHGFSIIYIERF